MSEAKSDASLSLAKSCGSSRDEYMALTRALIAAYPETPLEAIRLFSADYTIENIVHCAVKIAHCQRLNLVVFFLSLRQNASRFFFRLSIGDKLTSFVLRISSSFFDNSL